MPGAGFACRQSCTLPGATVSASTVRRYVRQRREELGQVARETFVPQVYKWGGEAQVDCYDAEIEVAGERRPVYVFAIRSMASGGGLSCGLLSRHQQAFLEAHELGFGYFGGVFRRLRCDNLKSVVKKILRGYQREETSRLPVWFSRHIQLLLVFRKPVLSKAGLCPADVNSHTLR